VKSRAANSFFEFREPAWARGVALSADSPARGQMKEKTPKIQIHAEMADTPKFVRTIIRVNALVCSKTAYSRGMAGKKRLNNAVSPGTT
jgi:hypothetical protein